MRSWGVAVALLCAGPIVWADPEETPGAWYCARHKAEVPTALAGAPTPTPRDVLDDLTDVLHNHLDITLTFDTPTISGSNVMTVRSLIDGLNLFEFRLADVFTIGAVEVNGVVAPWTRTAFDTVAVELGAGFDVDEVFTVSVSYSGPPVSGGTFGSISFRTRNGAKEAWTLSQPWFAYTWWPAKDHLPDKTTADLWFTVPSELLVASNGVLLGVDDVGNGQHRFRWQTTYPTADYLYCFGATNYHEFGAVWERDGLTMPLSFYIYPEQDTAGNRSAWLKTTDMLQVFSELFGLYPFTDEKYGMCQVGFGGGMEHQTMTSQGGFWESVTAHELAHQWWGDNVTCESWHDIWLNEGFATYSEALWLEFKANAPSNALQSAMSNRRPTFVDDSVYVYDDTNQSRIFSYQLTYLKGAWVVHMLRYVLGDEKFFETLAAYRDLFGGGSASTADFQMVAEMVAGEELAWFFEPWIYDIGAPTYRYAWRNVTVGSQPYVEIYIQQVLGGEVAVPVFTMPVELEFVYGFNRQRVTAWNDAEAEHFLVPAAQSVVTQVNFDPTPRILRKGVSSTTWVAGPPKIVTAAPAPGAVFVPGENVGAVQLTFHQAVTISAADVQLLRVYGGPVAGDFSYNGTTRTATFTPQAALAAGRYRVYVSDAVLGDAGLALDGEIDAPHASSVLPSGDGLPGGAADYEFVVAPRGDVNCDGAFDFGDIDAFVTALSGAENYAAVYPSCPYILADINGDGVVDFGDIVAFVEALTP